MKVIQFVANISYKDISKLFSVLWVEDVFENLLNAVVQEFEIPSQEATEKILCDLSGTSHTKNSFEDYVYRSISEGKVPQFRVITLPLSDNAITSSTNQSECKEDVDKQIETEIVSTNKDEPQPAEPTHSLNESEVDIKDLHRELETRKAKLELFAKALLEFESRLKKREQTLNQRDLDLCKLRKRLNKRDEKLKNREAKLDSQESDVSLQHYSLSKLKDILHGLSSDMNARREELNEQEFALQMRQAMLDEEKNKIKGGSGASILNLNRSRDLSERVSMELEKKASKQKRRGSESSGVSEDQVVKVSEPNGQPIDAEAMWAFFNQPSARAEQPVKQTRKFKTKKISN